MNNLVVGFHAAHRATCEQPYASDVDREMRDEIECPRCGAVVRRSDFDIPWPPETLDPEQQGVEIVAHNTSVRTSRTAGDLSEMARSARIDCDGVVVHECGAPDGEPLPLRCRVGDNVRAAIRDRRVPPRVPFATPEN